MRIQSEIVPAKPKEYVSGECFTYLGKNYRLKLSENGPVEVKLKSGQLVLGVDKFLSDAQKESFIREQLIQWYWIHAEKRLVEKATRYAKIIGVEPRVVSIKNYKSRWGGCSIHGDIFFNWKIIIAPHHIVDYVVVHELCHMKHHDHSPNFWKCVESVNPYYRECRDWLKVNNRMLDFN